MNSRERVIRALRFEQPDRAPRDLWYLPGTEMFHKDQLDEILQRYPVDIARPPAPYGPSQRAVGTPNIAGSYTDEWGCGWTVAESGVVGEVKNPPLADWAALANYEAPYEMLDGFDCSAVNTFCLSNDRFVLAGTGLRPFERMQFLRGSENLFMDLAYDTDEMLHLRDKVQTYFLRELELWCETKVDGISFMDDWGAQKGLLISPVMWRELFKPLYAEYCQMIHAAGKYVFMHSDGDIHAIYPDLIELGVDALNSQLFCMDIEELAHLYRGKITFWGEIDRQHILPFGSVADVQEAVQRVRTALDDGSGGVIAQFEWGLDVPRENAKAAFEAWL